MSWTRYLRGGGFLSLGDDPESFPGVVAGNPEESEGYSRSVGVSMSNGQENSQPENEMFPPESFTSGDPDEGKDVGDTGEKDLEPHEIPGPDEEDGLFALGMIWNHLPKNLESGKSILVRAIGMTNNPIIPK